MNLRVMRNETLRSAMLLTLCGLVFLFALHAKTAVYNGGAPAKVTPVTASKLWLSGQKMEACSVDSSAECVVLDDGRSVCSDYIFQREPGVQSVFLAPLPRDLSLRYVQRFLRPPPVQG